ncbi:Pls/PosA family non-ribosomal peptide synthetase [Nocardioides anomalus]|uniref:Pls/PosA family non-ribosomal peptide synthetase n=1 Tax=Nocardioides anomalus TaxID=2712223 RepID=UPI001E4884B3|nr:Pls/PosA family non-ribosomal peptide synthetase [Nocardioides anomalus]
MPGVVGAAAAVRRTAAGNQLLVGYVATDERFDQGQAMDVLRHALPAALVPRLAQVDVLPTRTSGKVDRDALPWPLPSLQGYPGTRGSLHGTMAWIAELWLEVLGADVRSPSDDFFDLGGGSLTAAQMVSRLRERFPEVVVGDLYEHPTVGTLAAHLDTLGAAGPASDRTVPPTPLKTQAGQVVGTLLLRALAGPRWLVWVGIGSRVLADGLGWTVLPQPSWWLLLVGWLVFVTPPGTMLLAAAGARLLLRGVEPGEHPRGGKVHLRLWLATRLVDELGATGLAGAPYMTWFARLLGADIGRDVDLHSVPPVTGMLRLGAGSSVEPEVDLSGFWVDGDVLHLGEVRVGARARVGARSMLCPGADVGKDAEVAPGSAVFGSVPDGEFWSGSPAERVQERARGPWSDRPSSTRAWVAAYGAVAVLLGGLPLLALLAGAALPVLASDDPTSYAELWALLAWLPASVVVAFVVLAGLVWLVVRVAGLAVAPGVHRVRSGTGLAVWTTVRVLDDARTWLFPLYSSSLTPFWLRALGARVGRHVEASTVLLVPSLTQVNDEAFLADDTLIGGYELGGGWIRVERVKIGKRAFVGNSGMAAPGRKVPKASLVAVLSAAPRRKKAQAGESWLGSPPAPLRRTAAEGDAGRTYAPPTRLKVLRALVEACRVVPVALAGGTGVAVAITLAWLLDQSALLALVLAGPVLAVAGMAAALVTVVAKWVLVGRHRPGAHPLWSGFVWRNELADTFVEVLAAPWFARAVAGTPLLNVWFRLMGARIGRGVWCESYWLPETDLVELGDGVTVNQGTVVQTHLFHDRMLTTDRVVLKRGATLGPNSVILPAATLGRHATVGPVSLVMRGESVPDGTVWIGNPIGPWTAAAAETAR